jgi:DNA-binding transcriptional LysR family regulator
MDYAGLNDCWTNVDGDAYAPVADFTGRDSMAAPVVALGGRHIDVDLLLLFHAVAETLSFTKAAKALAIDQSWLSHKIRQFEAALGLKLFIRTTRNVELTAAGRSLLAPVRNMADVVHRAHRAAEALSASISGVLRIGALPFGFPDPQRTRLIDRFIEQKPDVQLEILSGPTPMLLEHLHAGRVDLAIVSAPFDVAGLDLLLLRENRFCIMIPKAHRFATLPTIEAEHLQGVKIVLPSGRHSPAAFDTYYKPLLEAGAIAVRIPEFQCAPAYASDWDLPIVCTQFAAERYNRRDFIIKPLGFIPLCRKYLARLNNHRSPPQQMMWDIFVESLGDGRVAA